MPERLRFDGEHLDDLGQGFSLEFEGLNICLHGRVRCVRQPAINVRDVVAETLKSHTDPLDRVIGSLRRHQAERNRSGGDGQGSLGGEPASELGEDCEVGVEPEPIKPSDSERE